MAENAGAIPVRRFPPSVPNAAGNREGRLQRRLHAVSTALAVLAFAVAPLAVGAYVVHAWLSDSVLAFDFHYAYASGSDAVLAGESPYTTPDDPTLPDGSKYVYPPLTAYLVTPFALLPAGLGDWVFTAAMIASVLGTLRLLGVRDWRIYGVVFLWPSVLVGILNANASVPIMLVLALAWRSRDARVPRALAVGVVAALKLFLWPLVLWIWAIRGRRAGAAAGLAAAVLVLGPWALIGFAGLADYPELVRALEGELAGASYSLYAFVLQLGAPTGVARAVSLVVALGAIAAGIVVGRRGDDRRSFTLIIAGALLGTPLVWIHYLSLLVVVLALARPVLSPVWLAPTVLWGLPMVHFLESTTGEAALVLGVVALVLGTALRTPPGAPRSGASTGGRRHLLGAGLALIAAGLVVADLPSGVLVVGLLLVVLGVQRPRPTGVPVAPAGSVCEA